jgi:hypothetical protein
MDGGVIQAMFTDTEGIELDVIVVDYDYEGSSEDIVLVPQEGGDLTDENKGEKACVWMEGVAWRTILI